MIDSPELVLFVAIKPTKQEESGKLARELGWLIASDPTAEFERELDSWNTIIRGTSELQLRSLVDGLIREVTVDATANELQVSYRETIRHTAEYEYTHKMITGGHGHHARCNLRIELNAGCGYVFENLAASATFPDKFIPEIANGVTKALKGGVLAGYPMIDVKVSLLDGAYDEAFSSGMAFKICGSICVREAARQADPILLEPGMRLEVTVPEEHLTSVKADLASRRGHLNGVESRATITSSVRWCRLQKCSDIRWISTHERMGRRFARSNSFDSSHCQVRPWLRTFLPSKLSLQRCERNPSSGARTAATGIAPHIGVRHLPADFETPHPRAAFRAQE
jgi:translation elongation factor EF-G